MATAPKKDRAVGGSLAAGFFLVLAVLLASGILSYLNGQKVVRSQERVDRSQQLLEAIVDTTANISSAESSVRGYLLFSAKLFESEYESSERKLLKSVARIQQLTVDSPQQQQQAARDVQALVAVRTQTLDQAVERHRKGLRPIPPGDPRSIPGLTVRQHVFQILVGMRNREQELILASKEQSRQSVSLAFVGLWISCLLGCMVLTGFFVLVVRYVESVKQLRSIEADRALELEERVRERTSELSSANSDLQAFSYSVSHDLRAPLRAMNGYASILKLDATERLNAEDLRMLDRIQVNCNKMSDLIESLLALFRVGKAGMLVEAVDITELATDVVHDLRGHYPDTIYNFTIQADLKDTGDRQMLRALLVNLIGNAMKFSAGSHNPTIEMSRSFTNEGTAYSVHDNGAGFDQAQAGLLFEPFHRLHRDSEFAGNGIGLAICRKIVTRHRGLIWLDSELGKGTTAHFTLRLKTEAVESSMKAKSMVL